MKVAVIGGGPAGLYFSLLMKKADPAHEVVLLERNAPDATFGWGVVFSDQTLGNFKAADPESFQEISDNFARWDDIDIHFKGRTITSGGHGFAGIARMKLLEILQQRAAGLGVDLRFGCEVRRRSGSARSGARRRRPGGGRGRRQQRGPPAPRGGDPAGGRIGPGQASSGSAPRGGSTPSPSSSSRTERGIFQVHAYRFSETHSAFIVECDEAVLAQRRVRPHGRRRHDRGLRGDVRPLARRPPAARQHPAPPARGALAQLLARVLRTLVAALGPGNPGPDRRRRAHGPLLHRLRHQARHGGRDRALPHPQRTGRGGSWPRALQAYEDERRTEALRLQNAARNSMEWFENVRRYARLDPEQFAYSLLTRSQRVSHENLRLRDQRYLEGVERWFASRAEPQGSCRQAPPPMFTPFTLRGMTVENRVVVSPMDMYSAEDGTPNDFHLVHLGARAMGGAGLVVTEMTCVSPEARISLGCTGMYRPEHMAAWRRVVDFVHAAEPRQDLPAARPLGRQGRDHALMWEGMDEPLDADGWPVAGGLARRLQARHAGAPRDDPRRHGPRARRVRPRRRAWRSRRSSTWSSSTAPTAISSRASSRRVSNRRTDEYGGSLANRLRFPLEVFRAMRAAWPQERPMSVRISATDWVEGGIEGSHAVEVAQAFHQAGADIIHVSAGQTAADAKPVYGRMFQTPFSDRIRNETGIPTIAVGNITEPDQVNSIIAAGRADLCALARPHLADPNWTLRAAAELGYTSKPGRCSTSPASSSSNGTSNASARPRARRSCWGRARSDGFILPRRTP